MEEPRKFEIKDRTKPKDEKAKQKIRNTVAAGIVILGVVAGLHFGGVNSLSDFGDAISNNEAIQFALVFAGARGVMRVFAKAKENKKQKRQNEIDAIFKEVEEEERGNEDVRTR